MATEFSIAKVYLRSIIGIISTSTAVVVYGMQVSPIGDQVLVGWLAGCVAMVLFDKPVITEEE